MAADSGHSDFSRLAEAPASSRDAALAIEEVENVGGWLPWTGFAIAMIWWAGAGGFAWLFYGPDQLISFGPGVLVAAAMMVVVPGLLIIVAATMAAQNMRSARANDLVLKAAHRLLHPARVIAGEGMTLADAMKSAAGQINHEVAKALDRMADAARELGDERMRIEAVSLACADNARGLTERLTEERRAIETLARELRAQSEALNQAIPRQAEMLIQSARKVSTEVGTADAALEARLTKLTSAGQRLADAIRAFDAVAAEAGAKQDRYVSEMAKLGERLSETREMTAQAVRASDMATQAAHDTGNALRQAVGEAIEKAHRAAKDIHTETREAMEKTRAALLDMQAASESVRSAASPAPAPAPQPAQPLPPKPVAATPAPTPQPAQQPQPAPQPEPEPAAAAEPEVDLFDGDDDVFENDNDIDDAADETPRHTNGNGHTPIIHLRDRDMTGEDEPPRTPATNGLTGNGSSLRDILAQLDREDSRPGARPGALDTGIELIGKLEDSGIQLPRIFRPKDNKRLMQAAKKGQSELRRIVLGLAGDEVERVAARLNKDRDLQGLARDFMDQDGRDIISALAERSRMGDARQPRISAYLLVDAALNSRR